MKARYSITALCTVALVAGCDTSGPVEPDLAPSRAPAEARPTQPPLAVPVVGTVDGGTFAGTATLTGLALDAAGNLVATGVVSGVATVGGIVTPVTSQDFTTAAQLISPDDPGACDVLFLDLGPISLDLLGLELDLSQVQLDLDAVPGAGNLLGNLLCAVVHLLDGPGVLLSAIENLLDIINDLLN